MRVLVTGGAGFIGHHLVRGLLSDGHEVSVIDDFSSGHRERLGSFRDRIGLVEGSVLDPHALDDAVAGCEVVLHHAAIASVAQSIAAPRRTNEVNASGTIEVMLAAARAGARRVVFASSSAVYGVPATLPCHEGLVPAPVSPYGASKLAAEHYLHAIGRLRAVETVALRYFNVFGPGQDPASEYAAVIPRFATAILEGRSPTINGTGEITRDFLYVDNIVEANLLALRADAPSGLTCNVAGGSRISLLDLLHEIARTAGVDVRPVFGPPRAGDIQHSQADVSLAVAALGFAVAVPFGEGIRRTVRWYQGRIQGPASERPAGLAPAD